MGAANGDYPLSQIEAAVPMSADFSTAWECLDAEFQFLIAPIASGLSADELSRGGGSSQVLGGHN